ncbi:MAG: YihY/virulence factor BrkB family protein [Candidatus Eremiobacteraeota bacterium]|nr:YihY/virulence factor BrkB family protein [Candidatus Eremiobacteraeota bacterium]
MCDRIDVRPQWRDDDVASQRCRRRTFDDPAIDDYGDGHVDHAGGRALSQLIATFRAAGVRFSRDGCAFLAQALAFNAIFAVFPLVILTVAALAFIYGSAEGQNHALALIATLAPSVQDILVENLQHIVQFRGPSGAVALVGLLWSGKNLFQGLAYALNRALAVPLGRPLVVDIVVALVMLPILGILFIVATAVPLVISFVVSYGGFRHAIVWSEIAGYGTGLVLIFAVTMILYTYLPNRRVGLGFGVPGALFVTFAWELAQIAFAVYSTHVNFRHVYGALAAFALLLIWFYYMATIFLFGAELCARWLERAK